MLGRAGALIRNARMTPDERKASTAKAREGIKAKYRAEARRYAPESATPEQIEEAAARLWHADMVLRAARATEARLAKQAAKKDPWERA